MCFQRVMAESSINADKIGESIQATVFRLNKSGLAGAREVVSGKNIVYVYPTYIRFWLREV